MKTATRAQQRTEQSLITANQEDEELSHLSRNRFQ